MMQQHSTEQYSAVDSRRRLTNFKLSVSQSVSVSSLETVCEPAAMSQVSNCMIDFSDWMLSHWLEFNRDNTEFLPSDAMQARSTLSCSVCLSVRPSRSWIMSKRINISSKSFHHWVATSFSVPKGVPIFRREPP